MRHSRAFTLIELLIVVAIIAILAAIAVPNFLEAQVRSKVSRAKADMRTLATGIEAYAVDANRYPDTRRGPAPPAHPGKAGPDYALVVLPRMTTPVSYLTNALLPDPFARGHQGPNYYGYMNAQATEAFPDLVAMGIPNPQDAVGPFNTHGFLLLSIGPDSYDYAMNVAMDPEQGAPRALAFLINPAGGVGSNYIYDPTNGTVSTGDVVRTAKGQLGS